MAKGTESGNKSGVIMTIKCKVGLKVNLMWGGNKGKILTLYCWNTAWGCVPARRESIFQSDCCKIIGNLINSHFEKRVYASFENSVRPKFNSPGVCPLAFGTTRPIVNSPNKKAKKNKILHKKWNLEL